MKYGYAQPDEAGFYWFRGSDDQSDPEEMVIEVDTETGEVCERGRWLDISKFEAQWEVAEWSDVIERPE